MRADERRIGRTIERRGARWLRGVGAVTAAVAATVTMTAAVQRSATHEVPTSQLASALALARSDTNPPAATASPRAPATTQPTSKPPASTSASGSVNMSWEHFRKPSDKDLKARLTPVEYQVTQHEGTESPFHNTYWDNHQEGIYVDIVSGEPLFSSLDKFESGTGWPSFTKPLDADNVVTRTDNSLLMSRTEVRSKHANSHLGHVFDDGPAPTGLRYCMNSAAMRFIPVDSLAAEGYGEYLPRFQAAAKK